MTLGETRGGERYETNVYDDSGGRYSIYSMAIGQTGNLAPGDVRADGNDGYGLHHGDAGKQERGA